MGIMQAFYWATSEWSATQIEEAHREFRSRINRCFGDPPNMDV